MTSIRTRSVGGRVFASDGGDNSHIVRMSYDDSIEESHRQAARELCRKMGWTGTLYGGHVLVGGVSHGMTWVFADEKHKLVIE